MKLWAVITSCCRLENLQVLLQQLIQSYIASKDKVNLTQLIICVIDDHTPGFDKKAIKALCANYHDILIEVGTNTTRLGKRHFWQTINKAMVSANRSNADYFLWLQDDNLLDANFVEEAIKQWDAIDDPRKAILTLRTEQCRAGVKQWVNFNPIFVKHGEYEFWQTNWFDMQGICGKSFFRLLNNKILPVSKQRWRRNKRMSSGVGYQISLRLNKAGATAYQSRYSLIKLNENLMSVMHTWRPKGYFKLVKKEKNDEKTCCSQEGCYCLADVLPGEDSDSP